MPIYSFRCQFCLEVTDHYRTIAGRDEDAPKCHRRKMERIIAAPALVIGDIAPYRSMCDGSMVMGRMQHRDHLKRHGVVEIGDQQHHLKPYGQYKSPPGLKDAIISEVHRAKDAGKHRHR